MTSEERAALIEQIARHMCEVAEDDWSLGGDHWLEKAPAILDAIAPAIRRAALEEASRAVKTAGYPRVAPDAAEAQHYDEQINYVLKVIRMLADGTQEATNV